LAYYTSENYYVKATPSPVRLHEKSIDWHLEAGKANLF